MDPAVRKLLDHPWPHLKTYEEIGRLLPADDAELDAWFADLVDAADSNGFMTLGVAAIAANRPVDGRHLARGAQLITNAALLANFAWHMTGDVPEFLIAAANGGQLLPAYCCFAFFAAAAICKDRRNGVFPPELITRARLLSRHRTNMQDAAHAALYGIAEMTRDPELASILDVKTDKKWKSSANITATLRKACFGPVYQTVVTDSQRQLGNGKTVRRAVERIGRNEPCPCQSGRKYKSCCMARDMERLLDSSHIAGKSQSELRAEPEPYLTAESIKKVRVHEVVRFDPRKIAPELLEEFFIALFAFSLFDRAIECVELLGFPESLDDQCGCIFFMALRGGRPETIQKLLAIHPRPEKLEEHMSFAEKLATLDGSDRFAEVVEAGALQALGSDDPDYLNHFGLSYLFSKLPGTGILVARGLLPFLNDERAQSLLKEIGVVRDKLGLSAEDPAEDLFEKRLLEATRASEAEDTKESRALATARERLDSKAREVEFLRRSMEKLRSDLKERESVARSAAGEGREAQFAGPQERQSVAQGAICERRGAPAAWPPERQSQLKTPTAAATTPAVDDQALQDLRFKVQKLKSELKERHEERVALRGELREAHAKIENQARPSAVEPVAADSETEDAVDEEFSKIQPIRLQEYPRKFDETLQALPRHVARNAMAMIGRLAAGELAAFNGVVRLKASDGIYRQRIGIEHRLLFRLTNDRLEIVDLIKRRDLDRRLKTLAAGR